MKKVGIDDAAFYVPSIYLSIKDFAQARNMDYMKLSKGLGLEKMSLPDKGEDAATMAANALIKLFEQSNLDPSQVGRIYLGTESALDSAKPTATYALEMLQDYLAEKHGANCCNHIDVVDLTFACIGAIDALQNTADWVRAGNNRKGIVVASDYAKYELESPGEYTQGAGAVALLVQENPGLVEINDDWAVSTQSVHDFFKPRRRRDFNEFENSEALASWLKNVEAYFEEFKETPVFDGQFSNECYQNRMVEAIERYEANGGKLNTWDYLAFHLPYAFHGRRMFAPVFVDIVAKEGNIKSLEEATGVNKNDPTFLKLVSKTDAYKSYVAQKIMKSDTASSEVGNMYTASIFMSLLSLLAQLSTDNSNQTIGCIAYGSGSKAKVFSVKICDQILERTKNWKLWDELNSRTAISFDDYLSLHTNRLNDSIASTKSYYLIDESLRQNSLEGQRFYKRVN